MGFEHHHHHSCLAVSPNQTTAIMEKYAFRHRASVHWIGSNVRYVFMDALVILVMGHHGTRYHLYLFHRRMATCKMLAFPVAGVLESSSSGGGGGGGDFTSGRVVARNAHTIMNT